MKNFKTHIQIEVKTPQEDHTLQVLESTQEGMQNDKTTTQHPTIIPTRLLPKHKRLKHNTQDIVRAIGCKRNSRGYLVEDTIYKGRRRLQLIEFKYFIDINALDAINNMQTIYEPLKQAVIQYTKRRLRVQITLIIISITCNFHTRTLAEIA